MVDTCEILINLMNTNSSDAQELYALVLGNLAASSIIFFKIFFLERQYY